ncbi:MAG: outer membrane protein transport protein [Pseudomonadota bacterium]
MKKLAIAATTLGVIATGASAGSIQRDGDRSQILFEKGKNYLQFSATVVAPRIEGTDTGNSPFLGPLLTGRQSGNITDTFVTFSGGYKREINDRLTVALVANEPVGADVSYEPNTDPATAYFFAGSNAEVDSIALTGLVKYKVVDAFSVYGGVRIQSLDGNVDLGTPLLPVPAYTLDVDTDISFGYVLGVAYEKPEIGLRVSLTYDSRITHEFEDNNGTPFDVEIPQAVTLNFRTGLSQKTLLFGSVRWQEWTEFEVAPEDFLTNPLNVDSLPIAFGTTDYITYELGLGRRFSEMWSGAFTVGFEEGGADPVGNLEGRDGFTSFGASIRYSQPAYDVTFGVKYFLFGDTETTTIAANFEDNEALAIGMQVGYRF